MGGRYFAKGLLVICTGAASHRAVVACPFLSIRCPPNDTGAAAMSPHDGRGRRKIEGFRAVPLPLIFRAGSRVSVVLDGKGILVFVYVVVHKVAGSSRTRYWSAC